MFSRLLEGPVVPAWRMSVRGLRLKIIHWISGLFDHLKNFSCLSNFKYSFRSSRLTADLLTVAYDRIAQYCKISGANDLSDVICRIAISADDTFFHCTHDQASDLLHQLELSFQLESDLWDSVSWVGKWLVDFYAEKIQLF